jgi:hypothetical protein
MTPENSNLSKPPRAPYGSWEWMKGDEERSLDRMIEALGRGTAAARAVMEIKQRLLTAGAGRRP